MTSALALLDEEKSGDMYRQNLVRVVGRPILKVPSDKSRSAGRAKTRLGRTPPSHLVFLLCGDADK